MLLRGTTIDENTTAYFQGKPPCPSGTQQYMKIAYFQGKPPCPSGTQQYMKISPHIFKINRSFKLEQVKLFWLI